MVDHPTAIQPIFGQAYCAGAAQNINQYFNLKENVFLFLKRIIFLG
jgi:hypothetical protein